MAIVLVKEKESITNTSGSYPYFARTDDGSELGRTSAINAALALCITDHSITPTDYRWVRLSKHSGRIECIYQPTKLARLTPKSVGESEKGFDFTMGQIERRFTLSRISKQPSSAPDFGGAINVPSGHDWDDAAGVTVQPAPYGYFYRATVAPGTITDTLAKTYGAMVGTANNATWKGFGAGELCLVSCSGRAVSDTSEQISFVFGYKPSVVNYTVGAFTVSWEGWDYMWTYYIRELSGATGEKYLATKPSCVYVDRVLERSNFSLLPI